MAPNWPEEVDVFSVPHSRMKELVQGYLDQMTATNFSNVIHLTTLLENLCNTFQEFKIHEQIENKYILCRLRKKLRSLSIRNSAVCNCHSDNRLSEMLELVKDGFQWMWRPQAERLHYGFKLRRALEDFTGNFIPHMEEEEAIFQPMLIEYFSYDELKAIKAEVIKQHLRKASENYQEEKFVEDTRSREVSSEEDDKDVDESKASIDILPDEILLNILSYCNPIDLTHCAQVSQRWNTLALDGSLWTKLYPVQWARGKWSSIREVEESDIETNEEFDSYIVIDEDADIDETPGSDLSSGGDDNIKQVKREVKVLLSIVKYLLPRVGHFIKKCSLAYSKGLSNGIVKKILKFCPNLEYLNLKHTRVTDAAFKVLGEGSCGKKIKHLDLSGCENITDLTLQKLAETLKYRVPIKPKIQTLESSLEVSIENPNEICDIEDSEKTRKSDICNRESVNQGQSKPNICSQCGKVDIGESVQFDGKSVCPVDEAVSVLQDCLYENYEKSSGLIDLQNEFDQLVSLVKGDNSLEYQTEIGYESIVVESAVKPKDEEHEVVMSSSPDDIPRLEYLNLSGCRYITTAGIRHLVDIGRFPYLRYLNLSGCVDVSGEIIYELVSVSPALDHSQLYYCDNLPDDPFPQTASGCCNVDCGARYCCRN